MPLTQELWTWVQLSLNQHTKNKAKRKRSPRELQFWESLLERREQTLEIHHSPLKALGWKEGFCRLRWKVCFRVFSRFHVTNLWNLWHVRNSLSNVLINQSIQGLVFQTNFTLKIKQQGKDYPLAICSICARGENCLHFSCVQILLRALN